MVQKYQSPVRVYKYPFELVMAVSYFLLNRSLDIFWGFHNLVGLRTDRKFLRNPNLVEIRDSIFWYIVHAYSMQYYMYVCLSPFLPHGNSSVSTWPVCNRHKEVFYSFQHRLLVPLVLQIGDESPNTRVCSLSVSLSPPTPPEMFLFTFHHQYVCTCMCIYLFSCPSVFAPQLLILHCEYLV